MNDQQHTRPINNWECSPASRPGEAEPPSSTWSILSTEIGFAVSSVLSSNSSCPVLLVWSSHSYHQRWRKRSEENELYRGLETTKEEEEAGLDTVFVRHGFPQILQTRLSTWNHRLWDEMRWDEMGTASEIEKLWEWSRKPPSKTHRLGWFREIRVATHLRVLPGLLHASQLSIADAARHGQGRHGRISSSTQSQETTK